MAEFAAGVAVLGMLMLGAISVTGLQEVQRRSIVAAREAAFQGAWVRQRSATASLREQLASKHFDDPGLGNATGTDRLLRPADVELMASNAPVPGQGAGAMDFLMQPLRAAGGFLGAGFDLQGDGFHSGILTAHIRGADRMPGPFDSLQLRFDQPFALLGDDWSAAGPAHAGQRASGLVPTHVLAPLSRIWRPLSAPLSVFEPSLRELCFGLIEPDRVPEDRLGPGATQRLPTCS